MTIESPCVNICAFDGASGLCAGCGRTLSEIAAWSTMTSAQRRTIMQELPERLRSASTAANRK